MKITVIYHRADFDGIFCREIARKFLPDAELIGWDYTDPEPAKHFDETQGLYILDLSVPSLMDHPNLIWIDHHKSAIEKYSPRIPGYRIDGVAACRLAWQWFSGFVNKFGNDTPQKADYVERRVMEPLAVRLAGEYDIWDKRDPRAELFQHGLRSRELTDFDWRQMLSTERPSIEEVEKLTAVGWQSDLEPDGTMAPATVSGLLENGKALQYSQTRQNESVIKEIGFTLQWEGLTFLACNAARYNSHLFTTGLKPEHEACFGFKWTGKNWSVSLYHAPGREHHDLSAIAIKHGGGGHRGACGFTTDKLPFL
jgi:hypothetical protein